MRKTITIADPMKVKPGDKAYFKDCDFGFTVARLDADDEDNPIAVFDPLSGLNYWVSSSRFIHATREVEEPEWPHPEDNGMHAYIGEDGRYYIYYPANSTVMLSCIHPWMALDGMSNWHSRQGMAELHPEALPLTELKLVLAKDDDDEW